MEARPSRQTIMYVDETHKTRGEVVVRPLQAADAAQAAVIWVEGLQQSIDAVPPSIQRDEIEAHFTKCAKEECLPGGSVGVEGVGLVDYWSNGDDANNANANNGTGRDRCMFVAARSGDGTVLGMVGVKRGMDSVKFPVEDDEEDFHRFSVWKMSVAGPGRRLGIGKRLIDAVYDWAVDQTEKKDSAASTTRNERNAVLRLYCGNPIAIKFYTSAKIGFTEVEKKEHYRIFEKPVVI